MTIAGSIKQEHKIAYLGNKAKEIFPNISIAIFEEAFRLGVEAALKKNKYRKWSDVIKEQPVARKKFFENILRESKTYLKKTSLNIDQIENLLNELSKKNRRYLG